MKFHIKDPGSAITHFIGMVLAFFSAFPLLVKAAAEPGRLHVTALAIFIVSMILLYMASTVYHTLDISPRVNKILKKIDHMMIFVLIAGTYTPVWPHHPGRLHRLAPAGPGLVHRRRRDPHQSLLGHLPQMVFFMIYIAMGWVCVLAMKKIIAALPPQAFGWLLAGGIIYTIGGVIYALKLPIFNSRHKNFGSHEIFHLFVMGGSLCHYIVMYQFVA